MSRMTVTAVMLVMLMIVSGAKATAGPPAEYSVETMSPVVVKTVPQAGDTKVDPSITEIHATFSKEMMDGNWSWVQISDESFPKMNGKIHYLADKRTCVLPVKLEGGKTYVLWLNSQRFNNFKDPQRRPAIPYLLVFETRE